MPKEALKETIRELQNSKCKLSGKELSDKLSLIDTHRSIPKAENGIYTLENTGVVNPVEHMKEHKTYKKRERWLEEIKEVFDDRRQWIKLRVKIENQLTAYERRTDTMSMETVESLKNVLQIIRPEERKRDRLLVKVVKKHKDSVPLIKSILSVKGIGEVTAAHCVVYLDINEARHISSFWKYTGLHVPFYERYTKGESSGGNKTLRAKLFCMAESQIKCQGPYVEVYYNTKKRLENSDRLVISNITKGIRKELPWKETKPCHRHGAGLRKIMKYFLADLWIVWRTIEGLPTEPVYPVARLGGNHRMSPPEERGWIY